MVKINQSEIQAVPIFIVDKFGKIVVSLSRQSEINVLNSDCWLWSAVNKKGFIQCSLSIHGIFYVEPQI
jgi:hypothetical protein